jgi:hypothetical protein
MCQPCYQYEYRHSEVGQQRRAEAQKTYQQNHPDQYAHRGSTFRDEDADYAEWQSEPDLLDSYTEALTNQGIRTGHWSPAKLDWVCFRMWQRENREREQKAAQNATLEALRPTAVEIDAWLVEAPE